jgi:hypothetical protein
MITVKDPTAMHAMAQGWRDLFTIIRRNSGDAEWALACRRECETSDIRECNWSFGGGAPNLMVARRKRGIRMVSFMVPLGLLPCYDKPARVIVCVCCEYVNFRDSTLQARLRFLAMRYMLE